MRMTMALTGLLMLAATLTAQEAPTLPPSGVDVPAELKQLNGYWKPESVIADGVEQLATPEAKASVILRIRNGEYALFAIKDSKSDTGLRLCTAKLSLDPATHTFTLAVTDGFRKGQRMHGIYDQAGERIRICYGPEAQPRPTAFEAPKGSQLFCETWVLEKK
ncbi:MAG: TIGR03067 domain-containing protein [Bacteroidales bacterium]|nr:TIGR03067 domain-containing protein [Bacteroidales bacterium]